ncbi:hypothetical protein [Sporichthya sp.]|uniref:hypothetical protein n=1 Tax=Sporichthya sp. TaxID=65475 RepID=UPI00182D8D5F|nr:hypothetical protein [Sporichthya sp.]MBA3742106.1 hypothetical protein [Sporichthya sp.]
MLRIRRREAADLGPASTDDPIVDLFAELDELKATVYRQNRMLRQHDARVARERAAAQADEHRRLLVAVRALTAAVSGDPVAGPEVKACAARFEAAVRRLEPEPSPNLT